MHLSLYKQKNIESGALINPDGFGAVNSVQVLVEAVMGYWPHPIKEPVFFNWKITQAVSFGSKLALYIKENESAWNV